MEIEDTLWLSLNGIGWRIQENHPDGNHHAYE